MSFRVNKRVGEFGGGVEVGVKDVGPSVPRVFPEEPYSGVSLGQPGITI